MAKSFWALVFVAVVFSTYSNAETGVGVYQATCQGTAGGGLKGQWQWKLEISHLSDEDQVVPESFFAYESGENSNHIWLMSFERAGLGDYPTFEKAGDTCNITIYNSKVDASGISGTIDSGQYNDPGCKPNPSGASINHAAWKSELKLTSGGTGTFHLAYQGYDKTEDPDYEFTCQILKNSSQLAR